MPTDYSRRHLLRVGGMVSAVMLAGCSSDSTEERNQDTDTQTTSGDSTDTASATETKTETENRGEESEKITVGDHPYTRWLPASVSTVDGSVNFETWYADAAEIRSMKDSLPDSLLSGGSGKFPGEELTPQDIEPDGIDDIILFRSPIPDPEVDHDRAAYIYLGTFDKQRIVGSYLSEDWAGTQTEYGEFTLIDDIPTELGNAIAISESAVIFIYGFNEVRPVETFADVGADKIEQVHEADRKVARLVEIIRANTFVRVTYGEVYMNRSTSPQPEGILGTGIGWRIGAQETEKVLAIPFTDESSASAASNSENFQLKSKSVDGSFVIRRQTIPTAELERFPSF